MDCGIPFCHNGCPLGNLIPEWNDLVWRHDWQEAADRLHATNNFPEFTGRLCPAPCEAACVLGINADPVTIKQVEVEIIDRAFASGWVAPRPPAALTGRTVAVIGSGPAGLAAAQQLTRAGHAVTVFERDDAAGGLLRYGIPEFKMEKRHLDRRLDQMRAEGTAFRCGVDAGTDVTAEELRAAFDAIVLCGGARVPRDLPLPGRPLDGIHQAMDYLPLSNRAVTDGDDPVITARGRNVVIIGGGDTGADCLGTAHRQGAASVTQLEILPRPPEGRPATSPGRPTRLSTASPVRTKKAGSGLTPPPRWPSSATTRGGSGRCSWPMRRPSSRCQVPSVSWPATWCCSPWASPAPNGPDCSLSSAWPSTPAATSIGTTSTRPRCRACSRPATWAAVSR